MQTINYPQFIKSARAAARDILRTRKVSALLGYIRNQKAKITQTKKRAEAIKERHIAEIQASEKTVERAAYELRVATDTHNPDVEKFQKAYDRVKEEHEAFVAEAEVRNARELEDYAVEAEAIVTAANEKIAEYDEKVNNWQTGKSKVDFEEMCRLAETLVAGRVTDAFNDGEYDDATDDDDASETTEDVA